MHLTSELNVGIYFDQSTGPGTIHHNVVWNAGAADMYHETMNETRHTGAQLNIYNNTFCNTGGSFPTILYNLPGYSA